MVLEQIIQCEHVAGGFAACLLRDGLRINSWSIVQSLVLTGNKGQRHRRDNSMQRWKKTERSERVSSAAEPISRFAGSPLADKTTCCCADAAASPDSESARVHRRWGVWLEVLVCRVKTHERTALPASDCRTGGWLTLRMLTTEEAAPGGRQS